MTRTPRGLAVLVVIAAVLGALVARDLRRPAAPPEDRAIAPGLDPSLVTEMTWERSPLPDVTVRGRGTEWSWISGTSTAHANPRVVQDALAALRAGRWQRTGDVAAAGALRAQLVVKTGTAPRAIGIAQPLAGTEQTWIVIGERALLVDSWVARALDPDPLALRERHPVLAAAQAPAIVISVGPDSVRLEGTPRRQLSPRILFVRGALVAELERALEAIEIVRLSRPPPEGTSYLAFDLVASLRLASTCPDDPTLAWVSSNSGEGCFARATYDSLAAVALAVAGPAELAGEPRPLPAELERVALADGVLELARTPNIDGQRADPVAIAELLAVLAAPAEIVPLPPGAAAKKILTFTLHGGAVLALQLLENDLVRRAGEPIALRLTSAAYARLARDAKAYADPAVWNEEPLTISELEVDGVRYVRGAVVGEWTRTPSGAFDPKAVDNVVAALASPRRTSDVESMSITHRVKLTVTPPVGAPVVRELAVARYRCLGQASTATVKLGASVCDALDALAR